MASAPQRLSPSHRVLLVLSLASLMLPISAVAEGPHAYAGTQQQRPDIQSPRDTNRSGYLGRYNPWSAGSDHPRDDAPRFRSRENGTSAPAAAGSYRQNGNRGAGWVPPYGPGYPYGPAGSYPYGGSYSSPMQWLAPWGGGLNPDYGNYWNDPYGALGPDTGILWSDMWRR